MTNINSPSVISDNINRDNEDTDNEAVPFKLEEQIFAHDLSREDLLFIMKETKARRHISDSALYTRADKKKTRETATRSWHYQENCGHQVSHGNEPSQSSQSDFAFTLSRLREIHSKDMACQNVDPSQTSQLHTESRSVLPQERSYNDSTLGENTSQQLYDAPRLVQPEVEQASGFSLGARNSHQIGQMEPERRTEHLNENSSKIEVEVRGKFQDLHKSSIPEIRIENVDVNTVDEILINDDCQRNSQYSTTNPKNNISKFRPIRNVTSQTPAKNAKQVYLSPHGKHRYASDRFLKPHGGKTYRLRANSDRTDYSKLQLFLDRSLKSPSNIAQVKIVKVNSSSDLKHSNDTHRFQKPYNLGYCRTKAKSDSEIDYSSLQTFSDRALESPLNIPQVNKITAASLSENFKKFDKLIYDRLSKSPTRQLDLSEYSRENIFRLCSFYQSNPTESIQVRTVFPEVNQLNPTRMQDDETEENRTCLMNCCCVS